MKKNQELQILEALYCIKINKPSLNKINFEYCNHILKCLFPTNSSYFK